KELRAPGGHVNHAILINHGIAVRSERAAQSHVRIELAILIEVDHAQRIGLVNLASGGRDFAAKQAQQRRLAAAVRADEADSHSLRQREIDIREKPASANRVTDAFELDELL